MNGVLPPSEADLQGILNALDREKASDARANWDDPGRNDLPFIRLSNFQLGTICKYGLFDDAPAPRKDSFLVGPQLHFTAIAGLTMFMRSDTLLSWCPMTQSHGRESKRRMTHQALPTRFILRK